MGDSKTYIVDLNYTMTCSEYESINFEKLNNFVHYQRLYCQCGEITNIEGKVSRNVIFDHPGARDYFGKSEFNRINCPACQTEYSSINKIHLLQPNVPKVVSHIFSRKLNEENTDVLLLICSRLTACYDKNQDKIIFDKIDDVLSFNPKSKQFYLKLNKINAESIGVRNRPFNDYLGISRITLIKEIFNPKRNDIFNENIEAVRDFLSDLEKYIIDIDKIKKIPELHSFYEIKEITKINKIHNISNQHLTYYALDEYGENTTKINIMHMTTYMCALNDVLRLYMSVINFSNISTILFTKGYLFFDEFITSKYVFCLSACTELKATSPAKILDVALNSFSFKEHIGNEDANEFWYKNKFISSIIFKNIKDIASLDILQTFYYEKKILNKTEIESLFQNYAKEEVFTIMNILNQQNIHDLKFEYKFIKHLIDHKYYIDFPNKRFFETYCDTINALKQIIQNQDKVREYCRSRWSKMSTSIKNSYKEYLNIKKSDFFTIRTPRDLEKKHKELSAIHAVFLDTEKADKFSDCLSGTEYLNQQIDEYKFAVIESVHEMHREHIIMDHCIVQYIDNVINGSFIPVRILDTISNEKATLGIIIKNNELIFNQLKGYDNSRATKNLIDTVLIYCKKNNIIIENNGKYLIDLQSDLNEEKKMPDYLSIEEINKIKKHKITGQVTAKNTPLDQKDVIAIMEQFKNK